MTIHTGASCYINLSSTLAEKSRTIKNAENIANDARTEPHLAIVQIINKKADELTVTFKESFSAEVDGNSVICGPSGSTITSNYIPTSISSGMTVSSSSSIDNHSDSPLSQVYTSASLAAIGMIRFLVIQQNSVANSQLQQQNLVSVMNTATAMLAQLADATVEQIAKSVAAFEAKIKKLEHKQGIMGMIMGGIKALIGLAIMASSGWTGLGAVVGATLLANGIAQMVAAGMVLNNPSALNNKLVSSVMNHGLFGLGGESLGAKLEMAFNIISAVLCVGELGVGMLEGALSSTLSETMTVADYATMAASVTGKAAIMANAVSTVVGSIMSLVNSNETSNGLNGNQVLAMGLFAWFMYQGIKSDAAQNDLKKLFGPKYEIYVEMSLYMAASIVGSYAMGKLSDLEEVIKSYKAFNFSKTITSMQNFLKNVLPNLSTFAKSSLETIVKELNDILTSITDAIANFKLSNIPDAAVAIFVSIKQELENLVTYLCGDGALNDIAATFNKVKNVLEGVLTYLTDLVNIPNRIVKNFQNLNRLSSNTEVDIAYRTEFFQELNKSLRGFDKVFMGFNTSTQVNNSALNLFTTYMTAAAQKFSASNELLTLEESISNTVINAMITLLQQLQDVLLANYNTISAGYGSTVSSIDNYLASAASA